MIPRRLIAATAAILTVLVVQATVLTPLTAPLAVSLPAVLVAAIGAELGLSAGLSAGFSAGLLADLGSQHPAGVLALAWLLLGAGCGYLTADARPRWPALRSLAVVTVAVGAVGLVTALTLVALGHPHGSLATVLAQAPAVTLVNAALAIVVLPSVRWVARALRVGGSRRAPRAAAAPAARLAADA
jgi:hypothetical protein